MGVLKIGDNFIMNEIIDKKELGNRLKMLRKIHGLKQREVAEILNISTRAYGNYEEGRNLITLESAIRIANLYKSSIDYIVGRYR